MSTSTRSSRSSAPKIVPPVPVFCLCRGPDEPNRSMIGCDGGCNDWFHWDCISLDETGYEDILEYICPNCEVSTGKSTTRQNIFQSPPEPSSGSPLAVDSPAAVDELTTSTKESTTSPKKKRAAPKKKVKAESKDDQEHVEEEEPKASSSALPTKSRSTSISTPSTKPTKSSSSSKPHARRTSSHSTTTQPFVPIPSDPKDDPTRKVCLEGVLSVLLPLLEDAEKAKEYAQKLEELVWTAEEGGTTVGRKKYQDRMRSLRFNVSKSDRTELRSGISNGTISPERLSKMNSNDLANPTSQAAYTAASEASLRLRTIPTSSKATPLILHNHKGVVEVSDSREEMEREEENQRRQEEVERIKRKREREYEGSVQGVLEQAKRRRSESEAAGGEDEGGEKSMNGGGGNESESIPPFVVDTTTPSSNSLPHQQHHENEKLDSDFAMEFNEFLTDDVLGNDEDDDPSHPTSSFDNNHHDDDDADLLGDVGGGGGSPFRVEEDLEGEVDEAMFDFFVDEPKEKDASKEVVEVKVDKGKGKEVMVVISEEEKARKVEEELGKKEVVWVGEIINPEIPLHGTLHARQVGGPPLTDLETWSTALLPKSSYAIIGRVPIEASRKFLLQMHLTPTKELVVVSLEGEGEDGGKSEQGLREFLVKRGRDALVQPHDKNALPVGGARDMYIVVLPFSDPLPEFLEIMDTNRLPAIRTKDYLLGVFIRARSYPVAASSSRSSKSKPTPTPTAAPAQPPKSTTPPPSLPVPTDPRKQRAAPSPIPSTEPPPAPAPPPATAPLPPPPSLPLPLFDPSSIASILAGLTGVIPSIATPPQTQASRPPPLPTIYHPPPPPPANYHLPPPPLHLQHPSPPPPPSSNSPSHVPQHQQQQYQPPQQQQQASYRYDASSSSKNNNSYPAPPPAGPDWYTPPSSSAPPHPQNGYGGGGQNGYTPQQQQQQYGRPNEYERRESGGDGGRGGRGGRGGGGGRGAAWDAGRGSDQGWGRRGGRGG